MLAKFGKFLRIRNAEINEISRLIRIYQMRRKFSRWIEIYRDAVLIYTFLRPTPLILSTWCLVTSQNVLLVNFSVIYLGLYTVYACV